MDTIVEELQARELLHITPDHIAIVRYYVLVSIHVLLTETEVSTLQVLRLILTVKFFRGRQAR